MKRKSPFRLFLKGFLQSILIMAVMFAAGFGSYRLTMSYYKAADTDQGPKAGAAVKDIVSDAQADKISKNLIYSVDEDTKEITHLVLEIFNTYTYNLDYITIPSDTQVTLSNELYERLGAVNEEVPQIISMQELGRYFPAATMYDYGIIILEDLLGIDISYYTVLEQEVYNTVFTSEDRTVVYEEQSESGGTGIKTMQAQVQVYNETFRQKLMETAGGNNLEDYIKEWYKKLNSNLPEKSKLSYVPDYQNVLTDYIYFHSIYGEDNIDGGFTISAEAGSRFLKELENNTEAYTVTQEEALLASAADSKELIIRILNGSGITGLAAAYQSRLDEEGYTVSGIGNYQSSSLAVTKIIVKEEGTGTDLLKYFKDAIIETGETAEGCDIEIILGEADRL